MNTPQRLVVGITGASGAVYGTRLLDILAGVDDVETHLVLTRAARITITAETDLSVADVEALADHVHHHGDIGASIASGSFTTAGMIVAPCSMKTVSAIVNSYADNLLVRAADVTLKERRTLVLMPRESPLHVGHCRLIHEAAQLGAVIAPPMPAFYHRPTTLEEIVDHSVGRVLDIFGIDAGMVQRWSGLDPLRRVPADQDVDPAGDPPG